MARSKEQHDDIDALRGFAEEDEFDFDQGGPEIDVTPAPREEKKFLGMTAIERMFLSLFLFMNVVVLGLALLLATNRIRF